MATRIAVIGAGIKGSILTALLSLGGAEVILLERDLIGSGATSTNHGRLHLGTSSWRTDSDTLMSRRLAASNLMRSLPNVTTASKEALYCFEDTDDAESFLRRCRGNRIPYQQPDRTGLRNKWMALTDFSAVISLPEYSFDPARTAGRFAALAKLFGAKVVPKTAVENIEVHSNELRLHLSDGSNTSADLVINCGARWCQNVLAKHTPINLEVDWYTWRLLCVPSEGLPPLERVMVVMDRAQNTPSALPHRSWVTIDGRAKPALLLPHDEPANYGWRSHDITGETEHALFTNAEQFFTPLRGLDQARVFSFAGVQGRVRGVPPGSTNALHFGGVQRNYVISFGGQASTALLDALEITAVVAKGGWLNLISENSLLKLVRDNLPFEPHPQTAHMIWDRMVKEIAC